MTKSSFRASTDVLFLDGTVQYLVGIVYVIRFCRNRESSV